MNAACQNLKRIVSFIFKADVVVNSISSDLQLGKGPLSQAILAKGGPKLQEELNIAGQMAEVGVGTILQTRGHNLHCHCVLHVVPPTWKNGSTSSLKVGPGFKILQEIR